MSRFTQAGLILIAAIVLALTAGRSLVASLIMVPAEQVVAEIRRGSNVDVGKLELVIERANRAEAFSSSGRLRTDLGLAQLKLAQKSEIGPKQRRRLLLEARESLRQGLGKSPGNPYAWSRLAYTQALLAGPSRSVVPPLIMSVQTGPNEQNLYLSRVGLFFQVWRVLTPKEKFIAARQISRAWDLSPAGVADLASNASAVSILYQITGEREAVDTAIEEALRLL